MRLLKNLGISAGYLRTGDQFRAFFDYEPDPETLIYTVIDPVWKAGVIVCTDNEGDFVQWDFERIVYPVEDVE